MLARYSLGVIPLFSAISMPTYCNKYHETVVLLASQQPYSPSLSLTYQTLDFLLTALGHPNNLWGCAGLLSCCRNCWLAKKIPPNCHPCPSIGFPYCLLENCRQMKTLGLLCCYLTEFEQIFDVLCSFPKQKMVSQCFPKFVQKNTYCLKNSVTFFLISSNKSIFSK